MSSSELPSLYREFTYNNHLSKSNNTIRANSTEAELNLEIVMNALYVTSPSPKGIRKSGSKNFVKFFGLSKQKSDVQESDTNLEYRASQSTMRNSTSSIISSDSLSTHSEGDSEDTELLRELLIGFEGEGDDDTPARKVKDLTKLLGTSTLSLSPQKSIQITRHKPRRSILKLFKKKSSCKILLYSKANK